MYVGLTLVWVMQGWCWNTRRPTICIGISFDVKGTCWSPTISMHTVLNFDWERNVLRATTDWKCPAAWPAGCAVGLCRYYSLMAFHSAHSFPASAASCLPSTWASWLDLLLNERPARLCVRHFPPSAVFIGSNCRWVSCIIMMMVTQRYQWRPSAKA